MTSNENLPPSHAEVDALAKEMVDLKGEIELEAAASAKVIAPKQERLGELKLRAEAWIRKHGSAHADKSKLLHGILYEIMGTFGMSTTFDGAAVELFRRALGKAKQARLLKRMFTKSIRYDLQPDSAEVVKGAKLTPKLQGLWAKCLVMTPRTPQITPRLKKKENESAA